jgi:hypothetical protein
VRGGDIGKKFRPFGRGELNDPMPLGHPIGKRIMIVSWLS